MSKNFDESKVTLTTEQKLEKATIQSFSECLSADTIAKRTEITVKLDGMNADFANISNKELEDVTAMVADLNKRVTADIVRYFVDGSADKALQRAISICYHQTAYKLSLSKKFSKKHEDGTRDLISQKYVIKQEIGLLPFMEIFDGMVSAGIGLPDTWKADISVFSYSFAKQVAASIGAAFDEECPDGIEAETYSALLYKSANAPVSKNAYTKRLQRILDTLFFCPSEKNADKNAFMIRSKDINFLTYALTNKKRNALAIQVLSAKKCQDVVFEMLHAVVTGAAYDCQYN